MQKKQLVVRPKIGLTVLMPDGAILPPEGATVPRDTYWLRRLREGCITAETVVFPTKEG